MTDAENDGKMDTSDVRETIEETVEGVPNLEELLQMEKEELDALFAGDMEEGP